MKSFLEGRQAFFVLIPCKVRRAGKCQNKAKARVETAVQEGGFGI